MEAAEAAVATETLTIAHHGQEHAFPVLSFVDRRGRKPYRRKQWVLIRAVERLLFGVHESARSTGAFANHLSKCTLADAVLVCDKAAVEDETLTANEFAAGAHCNTPLPPPISLPDSCGCRPSQ